VGFVHSDAFKYVIGAIVGGIGTLIAWVLQETSHYTADRRERRRAISLALTDLWEIEYHFRALNLVLEKLGSLADLPAQVKAQVWVVFEQMFLPNPTELHERYNKSVTTLASLEPVLGFRLRSKDLVRPLFTFLNSVAAQDPAGAALWFQIQKPLIQEASKALRDAVLELASKLSRSTRRGVGKQLERPKALPKELDDWLRSVIELAKTQNIAAPRPVSTTPERTLMPDPDKVSFIKAYFDKLRQRIDNLTKLHDSGSFGDEALILCLVYIDGLASNYYGGSTVKENFCKALTELSGNTVFGKLHVQVLLDPDNDKLWAGAKPIVEQLAHSKPGQLLDESEVAAQIRNGAVDKQIRDALIKQLWRYSVGAICYEIMRNNAVHGLGTGTLSFDETLHDGKVGFALTFDLLHAALLRIYLHVAKESVDKGEWFGRKDYFKSK
jgi:hypothetical protein